MSAGVLLASTSGCASWGENQKKGTYNQELSERRGRSAQNHLSNETTGGRRQNRRVEVAIYANDAWRDEARHTSGPR